jgi:hypothetical protein
MTYPNSNQQRSMNCKKMRGLKVPQIQIAPSVQLSENYIKHNQKSHYPKESLTKRVKIENTLFCITTLFYPFPINVVKYYCD